MSGAPWLTVRAALSPAQEAVAFPDGTLDYGQLARRVRGRTAALRSHGVGAGEVVATLLGGGLPFVEIVHAVDACGATLLPLSDRLTGPELAQQLDDSGARLLIHDAGKSADALASVGRRDDLKQVSEPDLASTGGSDSREAAPEQTPLALIYTSGTTGQPKGALLTRGNFRWSARSSALQLGMSASDRWLACMPLHHVGGLSILTRCVLLGMTTLLHPRFDPERVSHSIDHEAASLVSLVPTMLARLLDARRDRPPPPSLRLVLLGGSAAPAPLLERAHRAGFPLAPSYGLTEATSQVATRPPRQEEAPDGGGLVPLPGTELAVVDEAGARLAPGVAGEILVRGPTVMKGYHRRPTDTARALRDGWLHTGDMGELDGDGNLRVLDRRSDLIVSGGENVYPAEVERTLLAHPAVSEAGVTAVADPEFGQRPAAWLVIRGAPPSPASLHDFCRRQLAGYKVPVTFHLVEELPRNSAGKLLRSRLRTASSTAMRSS